MLFFKGKNEKAIKDDLCVLNDSVLVDLLELISSEINFSEIKKMVLFEYMLLLEKLSLWKKSKKKNLTYIYM
jgi:hypothetical protein